MNRLRDRLFRLKAFRRFQRRAYDRQPAADRLFDDRRPALEKRFGRGSAHAAAVDATDAVDGRKAAFVVGNPLRHRAVRHQEFLLSRLEVPALTITSDPSNSIAVVGSSRPDWAVSYSAVGEGDSEAEAHENSREGSIDINGSTIALCGPGVLEGRRGRGNLVVEGPMDASVVIHASYAFVEVFELAGPVRVAATHARARVLETTGQVDVAAMVIDFAGSRGRVTLSAEAEINLKMTATQFDGIVQAWAQRSVRLLIPPGFMTPIAAVVSHPADFVCRTQLASTMRHKREGVLHIFTVGVEDGSPARQALHLRSEEAAVVIDGVSGHDRQRDGL